MKKNLASILGIGALLAFAGCASRSNYADNASAQSEDSSHAVCRIMLGDVKDSPVLRRKISNIANSYNARCEVKTNGKGDVTEIIYYNSAAPILITLQSTMDSVYAK